MTLRAARADPGPAQVRLCRHDPAHGELLATITVPSTGGKYRWTEVSAPLRCPAGGGASDLYLVLDGPVRLASFRVDPA